jgi:hypothetical protein
MTIVTFMAALALALALWRWDRSRDDRNLAQVRRDPQRGRRVLADRSALPLDRKQLVARRRRSSLVERFSAWCAGPRRLLLLAPLPVGVCLLAVHQGLAGVVFLLGVPLAGLYLFVVTRGTSHQGEA